jgi:hypothetical protein
MCDFVNRTGNSPARRAYLHGMAGDAMENVRSAPFLEAARLLQFPRRSF